MKRKVFFGFLLVLITMLSPLCFGSETKGIKVVVKDNSGRPVGLYKGSYALLIGVSDYTAGWPKLESIPHEIEEIGAALKKRGFHVVTVMNPDSDELYEAFEDFIDTYGFDEENRLLFFFSGHGHSRKRGKKGYLVPVDAPDPRYDEKGFARKAIGMNQILTWSRVIEAKHALFLFDSCFSGTVFKAKALPRIPPNITDVTSRPVRQFISAGSAGEEVPARSVFTPSFIRALEGEGDFDKDGYITGTEMGMYLHKKVLSYRKGQTPQYGKIKDPDLDRGDFVFVLPDAPHDKPKTPEANVLTHNIPQINADKELLFWQSIKDSDDPVLFEAYIRAFPEGVFTPIAEAKLETLKKEEAVSIPEAKAKPKLFVVTDPKNATIRILNIRPKFYQGMPLKPGSYHVEVSHKGYQTKKNWITVKADEKKTVSINLEKIRETRLDPSRVKQPGVSKTTTTLSATKEVSAAKKEAITLYKKRRYKEAVKAFDEVLIIRPNDAWALKYLADAQKVLGRYKSAHKNIDKALKLDPNDSFSYKVKANILYKEKRNKEAAQVFLKALKIKPDDPWTLKYLADALQAHGQYKSAHKYIDKALKLDPDDNFAYKVKGHILYREKRNKEAAQVFLKALKIKPDDPWTLKYLADALQAHGQFKSAHKYIDKALRLDSGDAFSYKVKGNILYREGRYHEAIQVFQKALRISPNDAWTKKRLEQAKKRR